MGGGRCQCECRSGNTRISTSRVTNDLCHKTLILTAFRASHIAPNHFNRAETRWMPLNRSVCTDERLPSSQTRGQIQRCRAQARPWGLLYRFVGLRSSASTQTTCCSKDHDVGRKRRVFRDLISSPHGPTNSAIGECIVIGMRICQPWPPLVLPNHARRVHYQRPKRQPSLPGD